ncbi:MAG: threonine-phosphate decarboxylase [Rhodobacterales bacterium]|nr:MAG: threonine-phosphate decarboxylase [Rhodobacterales bacterium]
MAGFTTRDHGGGLDAAIRRYGGRRSDWIDLSTGINPENYPLPDLPKECWRALPDRGAETALIDAARAFWDVPDAADILAAPGASALIVNLPRLLPPGRARIVARSYNEHEAAFRAAGWEVTRSDNPAAQARVIVHPNNPTGAFWNGDGPTPPLLILDESFCDTAPERSHMANFGTRKGTILLKGLGKFWGLGGMRLGFAIGDPGLIDQLREMLGPWPVSGPALAIGRAALSDAAWAEATRTRLRRDAARLDALMQSKGAEPIGGTPLFRLFRVEDAQAWQTRLARGRVWSRIFPYDPTWLRLGLPPSAHWSQLEEALA